MIDVLIGLAGQAANMGMSAEHMVESAAQDARQSMDAHNVSSKGKEMAHKQALLQELKKEVEAGSNSEMKKSNEAAQHFHKLL